MMDKIVVLDFGSQYAHLICRRIRECKVYSELVPYSISAEELKKMEPSGLVFSGGPASVYGRDAPACDKEVFSMGLPILGICYGHQLLIHSFGGRVRRAAEREYGSADLVIDDSTDLFSNLDSTKKKEMRCWMSHADAAEKLPEEFKILAHTQSSFAAAVGNKEKRVYGIQFHPEVVHTENGTEVLRNFARICGAKQEWDMKNFVERTVQELRRKVGEEAVLCATSGGIDSTVTAVLLHRAIGERLRCIFVNTGLLRQDEEDDVVRMFKDSFGIGLIRIDAQERFLSKLKGVTDPEEKRLIIGGEFASVFTGEEVRSHGPFQWLAQGTLYPDVIESGVSKGPAARIKSHHNVAGLPEWLNLKIIEPLRNLYKDEVREIARLLGVPEHLLTRHPFPGPGLAVRIIGEITKQKVEICKKAGRIVEDELVKANLYGRVWQAFAIVGDDKAVGVLGDERVYGHIVTVRIVESSDAMTADWARIPHDLMERISNRITNEVEGATWVTYTISSKPPATIEPQ